MTGSKNNNTYTPKQLATYNRQKCINLLEKIMKNLFRMFRDEHTTKEQLNKRFFVLKERLDALGDIYLDSDYHREMKLYITEISFTLSGEYDLEKIRERNMTRLNGIQKIKNAVRYKKDKYAKGKLSNFSSS